MIRIMTKSGDEYEAKYVTSGELSEWFHKHVDEAGNVTEDIVVNTSVKIAKDADGSYPWVLTDYTLDRDTERIDPDGWNLKGYKDNPVVLWGHDPTIPAIGSMTKGPRKSTGDKGVEITGSVTFDADDPLAVLIQGKVDKGIITKGSVGFRATKVEWVDDPKDPTSLIYREQELYEFSIVNIPSNPNAGAKRDVEPVDVKAPRDVDCEEDEESYIDILFDESRDTNGDRDTSGQANQDTSDLQYLFDEQDEVTTIEELLHED